MSNHLPRGGKPVSEWAKPGDGIPAAFGHPTPGGGYQAGSATPRGLPFVQYPETPEERATREGRARAWATYCENSPHGADMVKYYATRPELATNGVPNWFKQGE